MNKKLTSILLSTTMIFTTNFAFTRNVQGQENNPKNTEQKTSMNFDNFSSYFFEGENKIFWDEDNIPELIKSKISSQSFETLWDIENFFNENIDLLGFKNSRLFVKKVKEDTLGKKHYTTQYLVDEIPVYGSNIILHTNSNGKLYAINGELDKDFQNTNWHKRINIQSEKALQIAKQDINPSLIFEEKSELYLYKFQGNPYVIYLVDLKCESGDWKLFINGENGNIIDKFNNRPIFIQNGTLNKDTRVTPVVTPTANGSISTGIGRTSLNGNINIPTYYENNKYYLYNKTKDMNGAISVYNLNNTLDDNSILRKTKEQVKEYGPLTEDNDNKFIDDIQVAAVDAYFNFSKVYDYYKNILDRNSIDNKGMNIEGFVHMGNKYNNAFWFDSHKSMYFGDGDGKEFSNLASALDVIGHELSHGVTSMESNLEYRKQSGALNEAFSDIIGVAIDEEDWQIGEDCYTPNKSGDALRDMANPHNGPNGGQPADMSEYKDYPATDRYDWGGVHINSGIINHAAYYIGESLGKANMAKLFYRANCVYWRETTNFVEAREGVERAAKDLFGENSNELKAVQTSFDKVGIKSSSSSTLPDDDEWNYENITIESPHPYANGYNNTKEYKKAGATKITIHFTKISLENNYDYVYVLDKNQNVIEKITGKQQDKWIIVPGDIAYIQIITDKYVNDYGYSIDKTGYVIE